MIAFHEQVSAVFLPVCRQPGRKRRGEVKFRDCFCKCTGVGSVRKPEIVAVMSKIGKSAGTGADHRAFRRPCFQYYDSERFVKAAGQDKQVRRCVSVGEIGGVIRQIRQEQGRIRKPGICGAGGDFPEIGFIIDDSDQNKLDVGHGGLAEPGKGFE